MLLLALVSLVHPAPVPYESFHLTIITAILVYEHLATLSMEVERIWNRRNLNLNSALFLLNRYLALGAYVFSMYLSFGMQNNSDDEVRPLRSLVIFHTYRSDSC